MITLEIILLVFLLVCAVAAALTKRLEHAAVPQTKVFVPLDEAEGRVCASSIIPYPPGIPIACPGEVLDAELLAYVKDRKMAKENVIGMTADFKISVGKE